MLQCDRCKSHMAHAWSRPCGRGCGSLRQLHLFTSLSLINRDTMFASVALSIDGGPMLERNNHPSNLRAIDRVWHWLTASISSGIVSESSASLAIKLN